jgi:flagellar operon protein
MADRITVGQLYPNAIAQPAVVKRIDPGARRQMDGARSFQDVLRDNLVHFSHHAETRLRQRGIELGPEQLAKIRSAIDKAAAKGAKESLLLMDNMAMIVNVSNRTVVTAMDGSSMREHVFTQIDSAVIVGS